MNDIGIETYSHWRSLARWHRQLAYSPNNAFIKSPAPKSRLPSFFIENPDAMNDFKKFGLSILKELSVERMHMYLLDTLIPIIRERSHPGNCRRQRSITAAWNIGGPFSGNEGLPSELRLVKSIHGNGVEVDACGWFPI